MPKHRNAEYANVRGLSRGLTVLQALNAMESGRATAQELSVATELHRTTVRRLLETLVRDGYVRRSESDDSFRLALPVRTLSEGFTDDQWIATIAPPVMAELLRQVVWPSDLTTPAGSGMVIRETTHRFSTLSFHRSMVGRNLPMLTTAAGRAYFSVCSEAEREDILMILRSGAGGAQQAMLAEDTTFVKNLVHRFKDDGCAINDSDWLEQRKIGAIALPVRENNRLLASLNIVYLASAITPQAAIEKYLPALETAVQAIETKLSEGGAAVGGDS